MKLDFSDRSSAALFHLDGWCWAASAPLWTFGSAATDTGTLSCSQPPTKHVCHICQTLLGQYFQLLEQRNLTNMSLTKDFSLFDCIHNECTVRAAWRCSGLHSLFPQRLSSVPAQRHARSGYQSQLWMLNPSLSALRAWRPVHAVLSLSPCDSWDGLRPPVALSRIHTREWIHGV